MHPLSNFLKSKNTEKKSTRCFSNATMKLANKFAVLCLWKYVDTPLFIAVKANANIKNLCGCWSEASECIKG